MLVPLTNNHLPSSYLTRRQHNIWLFGKMFCYLDVEQIFMFSFQNKKDLIRQQKNSISRQKDLIRQQKNSISRQKDSIRQQKDSINRQKDSISRQTDSISRQKDSRGRQKDPISRWNRPIQFYLYWTAVEFRNLLQAVIHYISRIIHVVSISGFSVFLSIDN